MRLSNYSQDEIFQSITPNNLQTILVEKNNANTVNSSDYIFRSNTNIDNKILNEAINKFIDNIKINFENKFISYIRNNELSEFFDSDIEKEFFNYYETSDVSTQKWLADIWVKNLNNDFIILNIVKIISKFRFNDTQMYLMIQTLFSSQNIELRDFAIRFFESMADENSLRILKSTKIDYPNWLEEYRQQVVYDIEETLKDNT